MDETKRILALHAAFEAGDLASIRRLVPEPDEFPNGPMPQAIGPCLQYAIYHSPLSLIRELLELGANPRTPAPDGFPPLIAALSGAEASRVEGTLPLLLEFGADPDQRGVNDYTALHMAVAEGHSQAVRMLLESGADPDLRTRIDQLESPREMALRVGNAAVSEAMGRCTP